MTCGLKGIQNPIGLARFIGRWLFTSTEFLAGNNSNHKGRRGMDRLKVWCPKTEGQVAKKWGKNIEAPSRWFLAVGYSPAPTSWVISWPETILITRKDDEEGDWGSYQLRRLLQA